jgi:uncharacterized protein DUF955
MPSVRIDPRAEAARLLEQVPVELYADLAGDTAGAVETLFDIVVTTRPPSPPGPGCPIDGTYRPGPPPRIFVADDVTPARRGFSILHELGHHFIEHDDHLNDLDIDDADRRDEEICNEVAASILIPAAVVDEILAPGRFTAENVASLYHAVHASRAACCVAAVRRLRHPGCVILGTADGRAEFVAHHPATPWGIARGTPQGPDSLIIRAARTGGHARGVTRARFAGGNVSGDVHGDAFVDHDGWVFAVLVADAHSPWEIGLNLGLTDTGPEAQVVECLRCDESFTTYAPPCRRCGDRPCPNCGRCSCPVGPPLRLCKGHCGLLKPPHQFRDGGDICVDCE